jgi:hypothetical protein
MVTSRIRTTQLVISPKSSSHQIALFYCRPGLSDGKKSKKKSSKKRKKDDSDSESEDSDDEPKKKKSKKSKVWPLRNHGL